MQTLLTIAGFDPSSGAGVTADLAVFAAHGFFGTSAITALTVQSTTGVKAVHPVESATLADTLACLLDDLPSAGVKIGMLATEANAHAIAAFLRSWRARQSNGCVVLDPVLRSSSGRELLTRDGVQAMQELLPLVTWLTPNRQELAVLTNLPAGTDEEVYLAGERLRERFPGLALVVTGGDAEHADDLVLCGPDWTWLRGEKIRSNATHGTGCAFSSALLARITQKCNSLEACVQARDYVRQAILSAPGLGNGKGPMALLWPLTLPSSVPADQRR